MAKKNIVDRALEIGLGLAAYSEEKVMDFVKDVSARGETKREDVEKFKKEFQEKGAAVRGEISDRIRKEMETILKKMNLATGKEVAELKKRIAELEEKLSQ